MKRVMFLPTFLDIKSLKDGKADTVVAGVEEAIADKGVPTEKLYGLGTDGAAVMTSIIEITHYLSTFKMHIQNVIQFLF